MTIELTFSALPPSINRLWSRTKHGMRISDEYAVWQGLAGLEARRQGALRQKIEGPYRLTVQALRPQSKVRPDLDNISFKAVSDLLQKLGCIANDGHAEMLSARWVSEGPPLYVRIEPATVERAQ